MAIADEVDYRAAFCEAPQSPMVHCRFVEEAGYLLLGNRLRVQTYAANARV